MPKSRIKCNCYDHNSSLLKSRIVYGSREVILMIFVATIKRHSAGEETRASQQQQQQNTVAPASLLLLF